MSNPFAKKSEFQSLGSEPDDNEKVNKIQFFDEKNILSFISYNSISLSRLLPNLQNFKLVLYVNFKNVAILFTGMEQGT